MSEPLDSPNPNRGMRSWWTVLAFAGVAAGAWFLAERIREAPADRELPPELADEPDLYIEDAIITQFRVDGATQYRLVSEEIRHFERDKLTRLTTPRVTLYSIDNPPWHITSKHGYIRQRPALTGGVEEVVFLRESVKLEQHFESGRHISLESPSLYLYPDRQYAETDEDVMIDTDVGRTLAVGLEAYLERGLLKLASTAEQRVHTIVLPGQFK